MWTQIFKSHLRWLGMNNWVLLQVLISNVSLMSFFVTVEKIYKWLSPPKESVNYNAAHAILESQQDTCQWFLKGNTFYGWLKQPGFLWIKGKCKFLSKFVNLHGIKILSSWFWENHFKVENSNIFMKLNWIFFSQLSNNSQYSPNIQFCYCIFLFWWERLTERFPAAW